MIRLFIVCLLVSSLVGCVVGTPAYRKLNNNGAFLLTQLYNEDILCVRDEKIKTKKLRCYYVSDSTRSGSL